jgi:hypothetical protein
MPFYFFQWTDEVVDHLVANDVRQDEFEQVVCHARRFRHSRTTGNPVVAGYTDEGRYLVCVFQWIDRDTILPVTAFEPEEN